MGVEFNERPHTPDEVNAQEDVKYGTSTGDVEVQAAVAPRRQGSVVDRKTQMIDLTRLKNVDPDLTELLAEMDLDGDGTINAAELTRAMGVIRETREEKDEWQKVAFRRLVMFVVALIINVALIGVVTYYIVWSTAAVRVDEDGNLVNKHEEADEDDEPEPLVTQVSQEVDYGLEDLFDNDEYGSIESFSYTIGDEETGNLLHLSPIGYGQFEREVDVDGESWYMDVVIAYIDGSHAVVIENPILEDYIVDPMEPYTISGITFGDVDADTLATLKPSYDSTSSLRKLKAHKGLTVSAREGMTPNGETTPNGKMRTAFSKGQRKEHSMQKDLKIVENVGRPKQSNRGALKNKRSFARANRAGKKNGMKKMHKKHGKKTGKKFGKKANKKLAKKNNKKDAKK